jgi:hypothetical protein
MGLKPRSAAQLERQLAACQAENEKLREAAKEGRRAMIEVSVLKGVIDGLRGNVRPLDTDALSAVDPDVDAVVDEQCH